MALKSTDSRSQNELETALAELGLSPTEQQVYMTSLKSGPLPITALAQQVSLERPYLYTLIASLREKGLVSPSHERYGRSFSVAPPTVVVDLLREKQAAVAALQKNLAAEMPRYLAAYKGQGATQIFLYEGKERFFELYTRIFAEKPKETLYFGDLDHFIRVVEESDTESWIQKRIRRKIVMKFLPIESKRVQEFPTDPSQYRVTRVIPRDLCSTLPATFQVFGSYVIFWQPHTPAAVVIQDPYIAEMHTKIFNLLWQQGKETPIAKAP
ncbi:MAG: helix-turn-helix domain-containing protein [Candidatus Andersenbacteria bacterium]